MNPIAHFDLHPHNTFGLRAHAAWGLPFTDLETLQQTLLDPRWNTLPRLAIATPRRSSTRRRWASNGPLRLARRSMSSGSRVKSRCGIDRAG